MPEVLVNARYRVVGPLGGGASATVFEVADTHRSMRRALKLLRPDADEELLRGEFIRLSRLEHPGLVAVHDLDRVNQAVDLPGLQIPMGRLFLVLDLLRGLDPLTAVGMVPEPLREAWLRRVAGDLAGALGHLHGHGLVHHDLKPHNFLVLSGQSGQGGEGRAVLFDLGLAARQSAPMEARGSPAYMAPEALAGRGDHRVDLYSLGATLFHLVRGAPPFLGRGAELFRQILDEPPALEAPWLSGPMTGLILRLLHKDPLLRPPSARWVLMELCRMEGDHARLVELNERRELLTPGFVGRDHALGSLAGILESLGKPGSPRLVRVLGEPGSGKTLLVREAIRRQRIRASAGLSRPLAVMQGTLADTLVPLMAGGPGEPGGVDSEMDINVRELGEDVALGLCDAMEAAARERPLVLHLPEAASDPLASRFLALFGRTRDPVPSQGAFPAIVIAEGLPDDDSEAERQGHGVAIIRLAAFAEQETAGLASSMVGGPVDEALVRRIQVLSQGNPSLVVELVRQWHQRGIAGLELGRSPGLAAVLARARSGMEQGGRQVMDAMAVWGEPLALDLLAELLDLDMDGLMSRIHKLAAQGAGIVLEGNLVGLPSRAHVDAWRVSVGSGGQALYLRAAEMLRREGEAALPRQAALMVAGRLPGCGDAALRAARCLATRSHQLGQAAALVEGALAVESASPGQQAALLLGELYLQTGRYSEAVAILEQEPGEEAALLLATALQRSGDYRAAQRLVERHLALPSGRRRTDAMVLLGRLKLKQGQPAEALETVRDLFEAASRETLPGAVAAGAMEVGGLANLYLGRVDLADELFDQGRQAAGRRGDQALLARFLYLRGMVAFTRGQLDRAQEHYQQAMDLAQKVGDRHSLVNLMANLGAVQMERGDLGDALAKLTAAVRDLQRLARTAELTSSLCNIANLQLDLGDTEHVRPTLDRARGLALELGNRHTEGYLLSLEGDLHRRQGNPDHAAACYTRALAIFDELGAERERLHTLLGLAEARAEAGDLPGALGVLEHLQAHVEEEGSLALTRARLVLRGWHPPGGELRQLMATLAGTCSLLESQGAGRALWRAAAVLAGILSHAERISEAAAALATAREVREAIMKRTPEVYHEAMEQDPDAEALRRLWPTLLQRGPATSGAAGVAGVAGAGRDLEERPLRRLLAINKRLNSEHHLPRLLDFILDTVIDLTGAERGFLLLQDPDGSLDVKVARNFDQQSLEPGEVSLSRSIAERAALSGEPVITVDATEDGRFQEALSVSHLRLRSVLASPLTVKGRTVGTIYVDHRLRQGAFGDQEVGLVQDLADQAAIAIENARLLLENHLRQDEIQRLNQELQGRVQRQQEELQGVREELRSSKQALTLQFDYKNIVGRSPGMMELFRLMDRITETDLPVVIQGESGTGKELVARAIHLNGARASGPFVGENCGAIPETLLESVLFGHVKGAYTGADRDRKGLFEVATGGTLFLDEVGEMSPAMQIKLLRVLQDGEVRRVGGTRTLSTDVRVITASNRDLSQLVAEGAFREDLFYRLNVVQVRIPPLRQRREDIPLLVDHFLGKHSPDRPRILRPATMAALVGHGWPGNVRELENEIMRVAALAGEVIGVEDLSPQVRGSVPLGLGDPDDLNLRARVEHLEKEMILRALERTEGNQTRAAQLLGLSRFGLLKKIKRYELNLKDRG